MRTPGQDSSQLVRTMSRGGLWSRWAVQQHPTFHHIKGMSRRMTRSETRPSFAREGAISGRENQLVHIQRCKKHGETAARLKSAWAGQRERPRMESFNPTSAPSNRDAMHRCSPNQSTTQRATNSCKGWQGTHFPLSPLVACWWEDAPFLRRVGRACPNLLASLEPRFKKDVGATNLC